MLAPIPAILKWLGRKVEGSVCILTLHRPGEMVQPELQGKLLRFCSEVALGLEYLAKKNFVHRDISARNILLSEDLTCKVSLYTTTYVAWCSCTRTCLASVRCFQIADFGMSRDLDEQDYYLANGGMIPFKWTSPEVSCPRTACNIGSECVV